MEEIFCVNEQSCLLIHGNTILTIVDPYCNFITSSALRNSYKRRTKKDISYNKTIMMF